MADLKMKSRKVKSISEKIKDAWDIFCDGDFLKAYRTIYGASKKELIKEYLSEVEWIRKYTFPEIKQLQKESKREFVLIVSWNALINLSSNHHLKQSYKIEYLVPFIGNSYIIDVDFENIAKVLNFPGRLNQLISQQECYKLWPELLDLADLSLMARNVFVRIMMYTQVREGGLTDSNSIYLQENHELKRGLSELIQTNYVSQSESNLNDVLMTKTVKELKKFAFDNGLHYRGQKHKVIQNIVNGVDQKEIKKMLEIKIGKIYIRPIFSDLPSLKNYIWTETSLLELYLKWLHETKYLKKSNKLIASEREIYLNEIREKNRYDPMKPWRPHYKHRKFKKQIEILSTIWNEDCDLLLADLVEKYAWDWDFYAWNVYNNYFMDNNPDVFKKVKNHLIQLCEQRLDELGISVRKPILRECANCGIEFIEWSVKDYYSNFVNYKILFCQDCYSLAFNKPFDNKEDYDEATMLGYLEKLASIEEIAPFLIQNQLHKAKIPEDSQVEIIKILIDMPSYDVYKRIFGSWIKALFRAGVFEGEMRKRSRGIQCIANDGHECLSLAEKIIDDWLYLNEIPHEIEPHYPYHYRLNPSKMRADWKVGDFFIEYAGLLDDPEYSAKMETKKELGDEMGLQIIILEPKDLNMLDKKLEKIKEIMGNQ